MLITSSKTGISNISVMPMFVSIFSMVLKEEANKTGTNGAEDEDGQ